MAELIDLADKIKRYYRFTKYELRGIIISLLVIAFIISFKEWGKDRFDILEGIYNLFNSVLIVALSILVHDGGQKIWALASGFRVEYKMWSYGLLFGLILAFITNGNVWLIVPSGFMLHILAGHRLGWFRYNMNVFAIGIIAMAGPLFSMMLIIILKIISVFSPSVLIIKAIKFNIIYVLTSLLPIPPLDGSKLFFGSRMLYAFTTPLIAITSILMIVNIPIFLSIVISLLIAVILWFFYYVTFERKWWKGY